MVSAIIRIANTVTAPATSRAPGASGLPPNAAICWASRCPRASSKTTSAAIATTWSVSQAYTPAAARLTGDEVDRM
ncbi:hypothetical protein GCM10023194_59020 [Planotetraspora phitsanulokensis]|uniref:Uncharacterized protein n=1 Tax=Planotetraspora phitsanulokensis TaxID=575192 RepID=A0A8J3U7Y9_9ACTN|nr:hypothetical protein Pph01_53660 [Planotetraspora phitsanulokensis]